MTSLDRLIQIARSQVGVTEATGKNDGVPSERYMQGRKEPWCAHFVAWCFREAVLDLPGDTPSPRGNPLASVSFMERVFKEHEWLVRDPQPGDVIFYKNRAGSDSGPGRHVGIVVEVNGTELLCVEGNLSDRVGLRRINSNDKRIASFGRRPVEAV